MGECHHRQPVPDEGVVGVVPLGALGVHPDPAARHEVRQFGEGRDEELLEQCHVEDAAGRVGDQPPVGTESVDPLRDGGLRGRVELDRGLRVAHQLLERCDSVGHVGERVGALAQLGTEPARVVLSLGVQQPVQVDDLVIAPVADPTPGVLGFGNLPVDPVAGDPVGVESVGGRGVDELGDDRRQIPGEAATQRLPVLEDVAPVALIAEQRLAIGISDPDREVIPRSARITVASRERQRQVLVRQPGQVRITGLGGAGAEIGHVDRFGKAGRASRRVGRPASALRSSTNERNRSDSTE